MDPAFVLVMCAVLNGQVVHDQCQWPPREVPTRVFPSEDKCWEARGIYAETNFGIPREQTADRKFYESSRATVICIDPNDPSYHVGYAISTAKPRSGATQITGKRSIQPKP